MLYRCGVGVYYFPLGIDIIVNTTLSLESYSTICIVSHFFSVQGFPSLSKKNAVVLTPPCGASP